ncbi:MAG: HAD family hydrolase [Sedimentisphaerales bacterium]|nr:HAD family hydrolase [Sedimentisphaerales bacterium]
MAKYKHIIWDWNGTLFDDAHLCVEILNTMMVKRGLHTITLEDYRKEFGFPVIDFYKMLTFDFEQEDFDDIANEYISLYNSNRSQCKLRNNAIEVLQAIEQAGLKQSILSAYHQELLEQIVEQTGIRHFFESLSGLNDYYANCKIDLGKKLIKGMGLDAGRVLLIGDTVHDFEVSKELGCDCVLLTDGHQSRDRLEKCGVKVFESIGQLKLYLW